MTIERCKEILPIWSAEPTPPAPRLTAGDWFRDFKKQNGIAILIGLVWLASLMLGCIVTGCIVRSRTEKRVTDEVTAELRAGFQEYLDQMEQERRAAEFLTGDASFEAAVEEIAQPMSQVLATYSQDYGVPQEGLLTIGWVFCSRVAKNSTEFGRTPQEILKKDSAWEGKVVGHAVRNQDLELAREVTRDFLNGKYPDLYTTNITFFNREPNGKIVARDEYVAGPYTNYWWYGKK